jgi:inhibitor of cysteine peptidase
MSKKSVSILTCVLLLLAVIVAVGCSSANASSNGLALQQTDNGKTFAVKTGETIKVTLPGNPTTGYTWQMVAPSSGAALYKQLGEPVFKAESTALGAGGALTFEFQAVAKGEGTLKLVYSRPWESVPPAQTFEMKLSVE